MIKYSFKKQIELSPTTRIEFYESDLNVQPIIIIISEKKELILMAGHSGGEDVSFEVLSKPELEDYLINGNHIF